MVGKNTQPKNSSDFTNSVLPISKAQPKYKYNFSLFILAPELLVCRCYGQLRDDQPH